MPEPIKYYMDENIAREVTAALRRSGVDVFTAQEADMLGTTDDQHIAFAAAQRWVICSSNVDSLNWHIQGMWHKGIVYAPPDALPDDIVRCLLLIYERLSAEDMIAHVEFVPPHA